MNPVSISSSEPTNRDAPAEKPFAVRATPSRRIADPRNWHRQVLVMSIVIVVLALILQVRTDQRVFVTGLSSIPIPETCGMQIMFRQSCPGCGLTRSFIYLAHGDWQSSLAVHRVGWIIALLVAAQIPYRLLAINYPIVNVGRPWGWIIGITVGVALAVNWCYNLLDANGMFS